MKLLTWNAVHSLLEERPGPCISLYQPTHRRAAENYQDRIVFRNLVREVEESLREKYTNRELRPVLARFHALAEETPFWQHTLDGLAVLANGDLFEVYQLPREVKQLAIVADRFHVKPLIRYLQSADRYQVLCVTREKAWMAEGNRYGLEPLDTADLPMTLTAVLGDQTTEPYRAVTTRGSGHAGIALHYGQGSRKDEINLDTERFFRAIDQQVFDRFSKSSRLPLVLVALPEHQPIFRAVSQNTYLLPGGVEIHPESRTLEQIAVEAWKVVEPLFLARLEELCNKFLAAQAHQMGSSDLADAARAAVAGRIGILLVEALHHVPGRLNRETGAIESAELRDPEIGDLIDEVAEEVLRHGGEVVVVPRERMPAKTGLAAIFRF